MLIENIRKYNQIILDFRVIKYQKGQNSYRFLADVIFKDNSKLFVGNSSIKNLESLFEELSIIYKKRVNE